MNSVLPTRLFPPFISTSLFLFQSVWLFSQAAVLSTPHASLFALISFPRGDQRRKEQATAAAAAAIADANTDATADATAAANTVATAAANTIATAA